MLKGMIEFIALPFPFPSKLKIWSFAISFHMSLNWSTFLSLFKRSGFEEQLSCGDARSSRYVRAYNVVNSVPGVHFDSNCSYQTPPPLPTLRPHKKAITTAQPYLQEAISMFQKSSRFFPVFFYEEALNFRQRHYGKHAVTALSRRPGGLLFDYTRIRQSGRKLRGSCLNV